MPSTLSKVIKPQALRPGDRVGIVAPSSRPEKPSVVAQSVRLLEDLGLVPVLGKNILSSYGHTAGTDDERLFDLNSFVHDQAIRGIFCISGGFGALPLLSGLDYDALKSHPKIIVGGNDNTSIVLAAYAKCGLVAFHGPNLDEIKTRASFESLAAAVMKTSILPDIKHDRGELGIARPFVPVAGVKMGRLVGGNLSALTSLFGTPYRPFLEDSVLFLTDSDERNDILERWLTTINVSGELAKVSALVFGYFDNCGNKGSANLLSLEEIFGDTMKQLNLPSCFDLPVAGGPMCPTVPIGVTVKVDTQQCKLEFMETATQ